MNSPFGSIGVDGTTRLAVAARRRVATVSLRVPVRSVQRVDLRPELVEGAPAQPEHAPLGLGVGR